MTAVTEVTGNATLDSLSSGDYRDIYQEMRQHDPATGDYAVSLDRFVALISSAYSKALWAKYHNGQAELNRTQRNELRRAVGLPSLPPTVADAVAANTSPDAAVYLVGDGVAETVVLVAGDSDLTLHVNGSVTIAQNLPCNRGYTGAAKRKPVVRPVASIAQNTRREALNLAWRDVIEAGLLALESKEAA